VDSFREWTLPKKVLPTPPMKRPPTKAPIHVFESLIKTTAKPGATTTAPQGVSTTPQPSLFCEV